MGSRMVELLLVGSGMLELLPVGSGMVELLLVGSGMLELLPVGSGVAGQLTTEARVAEWLTTEVGVVEWLDGDVGALGKLSMSPPHSSRVDVFPEEESNTWTGATDALLPITVSTSLKKVKSDVGTSSSSDSRPWPLLLSLSATSLYFLFRALIFVWH